MSARRLDPLRLWRRRDGTSRTEMALRVTPAILYMGMIFVASSVEGKDIPPVVDDRVAHFIEYFLFAIVLMIAVAGFVETHVGPPALAAGWGIAVLYGASDEVHQAFVPGRTTSLRDLGFDALGVTAALLLLHLLLAGGRRP